MSLATVCPRSSGLTHIHLYGQDTTSKDMYMYLSMVISYSITLFGLHWSQSRFNLRKPVQSSQVTYHYDLRFQLLLKEIHNPHLETVAPASHYKMNVHLLVLLYNLSFKQ